MTAHVRRPLVSGNWKMNHDHLAAIRTVQDLGMRLDAADVAAVDVSVHPPFTDLRSVQTVLEDRGIPVALGAQHCHFEEEGAFTGEVSPAMLERLGVSYVIVGHSERRRLFGQTDEQVRAIVPAVIWHSMTPLLCVGEDGEERERGETEQVLTGQVTAALEGPSRCSGRGHGGRLRAGVGDRNGPDRERPGRAGRMCARAFCGGRGRRQGGRRLHKGSLRRIGDPRDDSRARFGRGRGRLSRRGSEPESPRLRCDRAGAAPVRGKHR